MSRDRDTRDALPASTQTARALPTHTSRSDSKTAGRPSKIANVEGPIVPGTFVTQRFERSPDGGMFERKVAADLILLLDAVVIAGAVSLTNALSALTRASSGRLITSP